jgi:uncharacterized protein YndB with AHSA1/START domain
MSNEPSSPKTISTKIRIERIYPASANEVWDLWTTSEGIESWWSPDGFKVEVRKLDLRPGGELIYAMTATGPEQVEFMKSAGMPLSTESRKIFTELVRPTRIAYTSLADFIPGVDPYEFLTVVDITPSGDAARVVMTVDPMHDEVWTQRLVMGRENELDNLAKVIDRLSRG